MVKAMVELDWPRDVLPPLSSSEFSVVDFFNALCIQISNLLHVGLWLTICLQEGGNVNPRTEEWRSEARVRF